MPDIHDITGVRHALEATTVKLRELYAAANKPDKLTATLKAQGQGAQDLLKYTMYLEKQFGSLSRQMERSGKVQEQVNKHFGIMTTNVKAAGMQLSSFSRMFAVGGALIGGLTVAARALHGMALETLQLGHATQSVGLSVKQFDALSQSLELAGKNSAQAQAAVLSAAGRVREIGERRFGSPYVDQLNRLGEWGQRLIDVNIRTYQTTGSVEKSMLSVLEVIKTMPDYLQDVALDMYGMDRSFLEASDNMKKVIPVMRMTKEAAQEVNENWILVSRTAMYWAGTVSNKVIEKMADVIRSLQEAQKGMDQITPEKTVDAAEKKIDVIAAQQRAGQKELGHFDLPFELRSQKEAQRKIMENAERAAEEERARAGGSGASLFHRLFGAKGGGNTDEEISASLARRGAAPPPMTKMQRLKFMLERKLVDQPEPISRPTLPGMLLDRGGIPSMIKRDLLQPGQPVRRELREFFGIKGDDEFSSAARIKEDELIETEKESSQTLIEIYDILQRMEQGAGGVGGTGYGAGQGRRGILEGGMPSRVSEGVPTGFKGAVASVDAALSMVGMHEYRDRADIKEYLKNGGQNLDPARTAWCAAFVNSTLSQAGANPIMSQVATSFLNYGKGVSSPIKGDVLVQARGRGPGVIGGHVGLSTGGIRESRRGLEYEMVSGNKGNAIRRTWEPAGGITVRRPNYPEVKPPTVGATVEPQRFGPGAIEARGAISDKGLEALEARGAILSGASRERIIENWKVNHPNASTGEINEILTNAEWDVGWGHLGLVGSMASRGIPWKSWRKSKNVLDYRGLTLDQMAERSRVDAEKRGYRELMDDIGGQFAGPWPSLLAKEAGIGDIRLPHEPTVDRLPGLSAEERARIDRERINKSLTDFGQLGTADLNVNVTAPRGTTVDAKANGIFNKVSIDRSPQVRNWDD